MSALPELFRISSAGVSLSWSGERISSPDIGTLLVASSAKDSDCAVKVDGAHRLPGVRTGPGLCEDREYVLWIESEEGDLELRHRDPRVVARLSKGRDGRLLHGTIAFRSSAGFSDFEVLVNGRHVLSLTVEVFPTKLDYRADFVAMLADIQAVSTSLAIDLLSATYLPALVSHRLLRNSPQEWVSILEKVLDELVLAFRQIERLPIWTLDQEPSQIALHRIKRASPSLSMAIARRGLATGADNQRRFVEERRLEVRRPHPTLDGPEHRWLRQKLRLVMRRLTELVTTPRALPAYKNSRAQVVREHLERLAQRVAPLLEIEPLEAAAGSISPSFASLPLMTKAGYREAYALLGILDRGLVLEGPAVKTDLRDIATLYEYWCFINLVRMTEEILGDRPVDQSLVRLETRGIRVQLVKGKQSKVSFCRSDGLRVDVVYNREFQASTAVLFDQRPDVVITIRDKSDNELHLVVDAKYRVERIDAPPRFGMIAPPEDAINALYRYRDAIIRKSKERTVVEAVAAFPANLDESLNYPNSRLREAIDSFGVGAIPFLPGNEKPMEDWLRSAMKRAGWETAARNPDHLANLITADELRLGRQITLVDVPPSLHREERIEFFKGGQHYVPLSPRKVAGMVSGHAQRRRLATGIVALFDGREVNLAAEVIGVEIVRRDMIETPYPTSLPGETLCVLYKLKESFSLPRSIPAGNPMVGLRWTSDLSLHLARTTDELLIETVEEWQVFRALLSRGLQPTLRRERTIEGQTGGHVSFVLGDWRARLTPLQDWTLVLGETASRIRTVSEVVLSTEGLPGTFL